MSLVQANFQPSPRQLRQFGTICLFALPVIGWMWSASSTVLMSLAVVGAVIAVVSWVVPKLIAPLFIGLMLITVPIGMVVSEVAMLLIYLMVFLPIGCCFKLIGRDRLQIRLDRDASTYWQSKQQPASVKSYYRQS